MKKLIFILISMSFTLCLYSRKYTEYEISRMINSSRVMIKYGDYAGAVIKLNSIIDDGWASYEVYLLRAKAYIELGCHNMAIKDCTLSLGKNVTQEAYFIRGKCKYYIHDSSYVDDLEKGGYDGHRFLTEIGYYDKQTDKQNVRNNSYTKRKKKEIIEKRQLKKDPNFKID